MGGFRRPTKVNLDLAGQQAQCLFARQGNKLTHPSVVLLDRLAAEAQVAGNAHGRPEPSA